MELEDVHLAVLALTVLVVFFADHDGYLYLRGKREPLSRSRVVWMHRLVSSGLFLMVLTGISMVLPAWQYWMSEPAFLAKMGFVLVLAVNGFFIGKLSHLATEKPFGTLSRDEQKTLFVSGVLSGIGWAGAILIGFFFL